MFRILNILAAMLIAAPADSRHRRRHVLFAVALLVASPASAEVIGGRPAGCPRAFCGCGAALHLFGHHVRSLWLARAWYRFPRSEPVPGTVAVRPHHVFVLESYVSGSTWIVRDYNSGGHLTRLHARSIAGYTIVNPTGGSWTGL